MKGRQRDGHMQTGDRRKYPKGEQGGKKADDSGNKIRWIQWRVLGGKIGVREGKKRVTGGHE